MINKIINFFKEEKKEERVKPSPQIRATREMIENNIDYFKHCFSVSDSVPDDSQEIVNFYFLDEKAKIIRGTRRWCRLGEYTTEESSKDYGIMLSHYIPEKHTENIRMSDEEIPRYLQKKSNIKVDAPYLCYRGYYINNFDKRFFPILKNPLYPACLKPINKRLIPFYSVLLPEEIAKETYYLRKDFILISSYGEATIYKNGIIYIIECVGNFEIHLNKNDTEYNNFIKRVDLLKLKL